MSIDRVGDLELSANGYKMAFKWFSVVHFFVTIIIFITNTTAVDIDFNVSFDL